MRRIPRNHDAAPRVGRRRVVRHVEDGPLGQALGEQGDEGADGGAPGGEGVLDFGAGAGGGELRGGREGGGGPGGGVVQEGDDVGVRGVVDLCFG